MLLLVLIAAAFVVGISLRQRQTVTEEPTAVPSPAAQSTAVEQPAAGPSPMETQPAASPTPPPPTTGTLKISTVPAGAAVDLDGASVGVTPLTLPDLKPGKHTLKVSKSGFKTDGRDVEVTAGETFALDITLSAAPRPAPRRRAPPLPPAPPAPLPPPPR
jgi:hypothetical protein